ncbi:hypothetical protein POM88_004427 [Heracleum sosnowskyi]|uniref:Uncharacterized protein n=1 Tax=Heracleum sosnowskyi TaxID=360622 RepID=A0AAD8NDG2_9APIA|nr:hypothetical protein POM88_004427 [Heracleum sosnowskyi]
MQGNARRLFDKRWDGHTRLGQLSKLGLAPVLWCMIFVLLVMYVHSVIIASNLPKLTAGIGLLAWMGVFLASSGLIFFYRCSRYPPENYGKFYLSWNFLFGTIPATVPRLVNLQTIILDGNYFNGTFPDWSGSHLTNPTKFWVITSKTYNYGDDEYPFIRYASSFSPPPSSASSSASTSVEEKAYDYIIVGGGTVGCPLAATLSQNFRPNVRCSSK